MSAHGDDPKVHAIKDGQFVCTAEPDAKCRTYPTCIDCEVWCGCQTEARAAENHDPGEHCCMTTAQPRQDCWIEPWITGGWLEDSFGDDASEAMVENADGDLVWPDGSVTVDFEGDYCSWMYAEAGS